MPGSPARKPPSPSPIFTTLTRGFDAQASSSPATAQRVAGGPAQHDATPGAADCPIFDQLAGRRLARRRSNFIPPD